MFGSRHFRLIVLFLIAVMAIFTLGALVVLPFSHGIDR